MKWMYFLCVSFLFTFSSCKQAVETKTVDSNSGFLASISLEEAAEKISTGEAIFLDVRTDAEIAEGMIPGSIQIDFSSPTFEQDLEKLDKSKEYVVYCKSGGRSTRACKKMHDMGFKKLNNMTAGYSKWNK